jgi:glycosyltransferase involved in cell wall biosynthesis
MIEAMACGTPTIAYRCGSVPEVMIDGVTGYIVDDEDDAVEAIGHLDTIARADCRRVFEQRYTAGHMARNYLDVYQRIAQSRPRLAHVA